MPKAVTWSNCSRLACASTQSPSVVMCMATDGLLAPVTCGDSSSFVPNTLDGILTKVWKDGNSCGTGVFRYLISYDETLLADPAVALTTADIEGVFCKGCLTTWVEDQVACVAGSQSSVIPYYVSTCPRLTDSETPEFDFDVPAVLFTTCGQRLDYVITGEYSIDQADEEAEFIVREDISATNFIDIFFDAGTSGLFKIEGSLILNPSSPSKCFTNDFEFIITNGGGPPLIDLNGGQRRFNIVDASAFNFKGIPTYAEGSSIAVTSVTFDYYDVPVICEGLNCCD